MDSPVDDAARACGAARPPGETSVGGRCCPAIAASNSARIGVDLNISARDFGASLMWTVRLESGGAAHRHSFHGRLSRAVARRGRRLIDHPPPVRAADRAASRAARIGDEYRRRGGEPLHARDLASHVLSSLARFARGKAALGRRRAALYRAFAGKLGYRRFRRLEGLDPVAGASRGRIHRIESAACARSRRSRAGKPL
jgi:hypothetical protein